MGVLSESVGLSFKITADSKQAVQEAREFKKELNSELSDIQKSSLGVFDTLAQQMGLSGTQAANLKNELSGLGSMAGLVAGGIAAVGAAVLGVSAALFNAAKAASDFGSEIQDFQEKTGLASDTIQTLKFTTEQAGGSLTELQAPLKKITQLMAEAQAGNVDAIATLAKFNVVDFTNLDAGLAKIFAKIKSGGNEIEKSGMSAELFGVKGAAAMKVIANAVDGNLPAAIKACEKLGIILSEDDVRAADEFGDAFTAMGLQVKAQSAKIALEYAPQITDAMRDISDFLTENKQDFIEWGNAVADAILAARISIVMLKSTLQNGVNVNAIQADVDAAYNLSIKRTDQRNQDAADRQFAKTPGTIFLDDNGNPMASPVPTDKSGLPTSSGVTASNSQKEQADIQREALQRAKAFNSQLTKFAEETRKADLAALEQSIREKEITEAQAVERRLAIETAFANQMKNLTQDVFQAETKGLKKGSYEFEQARLNQANAILAINNNLLENINGIQKEQEAAAQKQSEIQKKYTDEEVQAKRNANRRLLEEQIAIGEQQKATFADNALLRANTWAVELKIFQYRKEFLESELTYAKAKNSEEAKDIQLQLTKLKLEKNIAEIKNDRAIKKENAIPGGSPMDLKLPKRTQDGDSVAPIELGIFGKFAESLRGNSAIKDAKGALSELKAMTLDSFGAMSNAVGSAIEQWALYGGSITKALKQALAAELAHIAGVSTVKAIYATALGFLELASGNFPAASAAFTAAAIYGTLAVGTALGAKALSGNSFKKTANTNFTSSQIGSNNTSRSVSDTTNLMSESRINRQEQRITLEVMSRDSHIVKVVGDNLNNRGDLHPVVVKLVEAN